MTEFQSVAKVGDIPEGEGRAFPIDGKMIALFLQDGEYWAVSDTCPHMGASLATGYLEDGEVMCPWHAWRFCVRDGAWMDNPTGKTRLDCYAVRIEGDEILVERPQPKSDPPDDESPKK
ncbi:MAG: Rieske 2Fe-2S domain-containing protein [Planctomycetes bacterium]|nr:Rieske 2Fe-2S domain-containing protein [Planctomycetota bacterium]